MRSLAYGHAGDGNLHVNYLWNEDDERPRVEESIERLFRDVVELGGTLSGEHGIGLTKAPYLPIEQSADLILLQRDLKRSFDPEGLLNPGENLLRRRDTGLVEPSVIRRAAGAASRGTAHALPGVPSLSPSRRSARTTRFFRRGSGQRGFEGFRMSAVTAPESAARHREPALVRHCGRRARAPRLCLLRVASLGRARPPMAAIALLGSGGHAIGYFPALRASWPSSRFFAARW